jgi:hypothetical protein
LNPHRHHGDQIRSQVLQALTINLGILPKESKVTIANPDLDRHRGKRHELGVDLLGQDGPWSRWVGYSEPAPTQPERNAQTPQVDDA